MGTTIAEVGSGTISLAQLTQIISQIQAQQTNTGGGNIGKGDEGTLIPGPGLAGGGVLVGNVPIRLIAPIPWFDDAGGGGDGDPGPPGQRGVNGLNGATGGIGPTGPAAFMAADEGQDGDFVPGSMGPAGAAGAPGTPGIAGPTGPAGTTLVYANTTVPAGNTVANTSSETFFTSAYSVPANSLVIGTVLRVKFFGVYSTGVVAPSLILKVYFGATVLIASGTLTTVAAVTNDGWSAEGLFTVQTIGASGTMEAQGLSEFSTASTAVLFVNMDNTAAVTVDTTIASIIRASVQWGGTVNASDTITLREMTVEVMSVAGIPSVPPTPAFHMFFGDDGEEGSIGPPGPAGAAAGSGGGSASSGPGGVSNDLYYWFAGDQLTGAGGASIPRLTNSAFIGAIVTAPASGSGATVGAAALNSRNVAVFSGSSAGRYTLPVLPPRPLTQSTHFIVVKPTSVGVIYNFTCGSSPAMQYGTDGSGHFNLTASLVAQIAASTSTLSAGAWVQSNVTYNASSGAWAFRTGRTADGSGTNVASITKVTNDLCFNVTGVQDVDGSIAELILYTRVLSAAEITAVENYLFAKWGV